MKVITDFLSFIKEGNLLAVNELLGQEHPSHILELLDANRLLAFSLAAEHGHLEIMERLIEHAPIEVQTMIRADDFQAFHRAAVRGHGLILKKLMLLAGLHLTMDMIRSNNFQVIRDLIVNGHIAIADKFMLFPKVFKHAERNAELSSHGYIVPFVDRTINVLYTKMNSFLRMHPADTFDITCKITIKLYFDIMQHLIRRNTPKSFGQLIFLLRIPAIQSKAHQSVTSDDRNPSPARPNELLHLAREFHNRAATQYLLTIPAVNALDQAQQHRLGTQFAYRESSMAALTSDELKRLRQAKKKYAPKIAKLGGAAAVINLIKSELMRRYAKNPATVAQEDQVSIELPLAFQQFVEEPLSASVREQAFISYYQHPLHSAYRYLSKPNLWLHPAAKHIHQDATGAWSTYETHQALIALMYLAVSDTDIPEIDGINTEVRLGFFFQELALIGRAHNWDKTRINSATHQEEYYDNLGGDEPSCVGGVKRRLFQASFLLSHPLFEMLNESDINVEVIKIVKAHFASRITDANVSALLAQWRQITIEGEQASSPSPLDILNFTAAEQTKQMKSITKMFTHRLDKTLKRYLQLRLEVALPFRNLAEKFGGIVDLMGMLEQTQASLTQASSIQQSSSIGIVSLFTPATECDETTPARPSKRKKICK